jgi:hypothetical protein
MRFVVASFLVLSSFNAINAQPVTPTPTQNRPACNVSQASAFMACRDRCDETAHQCITQCKGQSSCNRQQCTPPHTTCVQSCSKSSGC